MLPFGTTTWARIDDIMAGTTRTSPPRRAGCTTGLRPRRRRREQCAGQLPGLAGTCRAPPGVRAAGCPASPVQVGVELPARKAVADQVRGPYGQGRLTRPGHPLLDLMGGEASRSAGESSDLSCTLHLRALQNRRGPGRVSDHWERLRRDGEPQVEDAAGGEYPLVEILDFGTELKTNLLSHNLSEPLVGAQGRGSVSRPYRLSMSWAPVAHALDWRGPPRAGRTRPRRICRAAPYPRELLQRGWCSADKPAAPSTDRLPLELTGASASTADRGPARSEGGTRCSGRGRGTPVSPAGRRAWKVSRSRSSGSMAMRYSSTWVSIGVERRSQGESSLRRRVERTF